MFINKLTPSVLLDKDCQKEEKKEATKWKPIHNQIKIPELIFIQLPFSPSATQFDDLLKEKGIQTYSSTDLTLWLHISVPSAYQNLSDVDY